MESNRNNIRNNHKRTAVKRTSTNKRKGGTQNVNSFIKYLRSVKGTPDYFFLAIVIILLAYGIMMLFSAGSAKAYSDYGDVLYFVKNQLLGIGMGAVGMYLASKIDYHIYGGKIAELLYGGCTVLLILVVVGLGTTVNGATRWLFGFQPSEIAKIAIIILFSYKLSQPSGQKNLKKFKKGFLPYLVLLGIYVILLALEPHFSCIILIGLTAMLLLFVAGAPLKYFIEIAVPAVIGIVVLIMIEPYRMARVMTFFDPFADMQGSGWQIAQSLYAIGSGGIFGVGLGQSRQKFLSLPEPHNDFIFSVLSEELGLIGATLLIILFILLLVRGIKIAAKAPDMFGMLLVVGIVGIVTLQALINIAVVTASIPVTGMPLPFFSYGSTALSITMTEMGIVLNVSRQSKLPI